MGLEEDIKQQKGFKSERHKALVNIIYTHNWLSDQMKVLLSEFELTRQQFNVLRILRGQDPNPISTWEIRERMLDRMSDVSRIVDRLEKKGLALRGACSDDKRKVDVCISEKGLDLLTQIDGRNEAFEKMYAGISEEDAKTLNALLDRFRS